MVKRLLLALLALTLALPADAQTFPKPPDVPAYVEKVPAYETQPNVENKRGNGVDEDGGVPPAKANELADIPSANRTQLMKPLSGICGVVANGGACTEAKFRTHAMVTHILYDDPIRNYGQPGGSHCHMFFGNRAANAYSTFPTLRNRAKDFSKAGGGGLNGTAYWFPCLTKKNPFGDGRNYALRPPHVVIYYTTGAAVTRLVPKITHMSLGLRYVGGWNMDDGFNYLRTIIDNANAASAAAGGHSDRYGYPRRNGHGWSCNGSSKADYLVNADGTIPVAFTRKSDGTPVTCGPGSEVLLDFSGPDCWDGVNQWSPGGYKHVIPAITDRYQADDTLVCPKGWYRLPPLQIQMKFTSDGGWDNDIKYWRLDSDGIPDGQFSTVQHGVTIRPGESFHTDWLGAWDRTAMHEWLDNCLGVAGPGYANANECSDSQISINNKLVAFNELNPQTNRIQLNYDGVSGTDSPSKMILLPSGKQNTGSTIHVHGN